MEADPESNQKWWCSDIMQELGPQPGIAPFFCQNLQFLSRKSSPGCSFTTGHQMVFIPGSHSFSARPSHRARCYSSFCRTAWTNTFPGSCSSLSSPVLQRGQEHLFWVLFVKDFGASNSHCSACMWRAPFFGFCRIPARLLPQWKVNHHGTRQIAFREKHLEAGMHVSSTILTLAISVGSDWKKSNFS